MARAVRGSEDMKRYNITAEHIETGQIAQIKTYTASDRIKIDEADNGEWVRYECAYALQSDIKFLEAEKIAISKIRDKKFTRLRRQRNDALQGCSSRHQAILKKQWNAQE
jgi:hypothetical protein